MSDDGAGRPLVMGILNVTPDSFSDGGLHLFDPVEAGLRLRDEGADWVDVGGESTRPGATPVEVDEERRRVLSVIEALSRRGVPVSVDTMKTAVLRDALAAGASLANDVNGGREEGYLETVAAAGAEVALMHMRGVPATMQNAPAYGDVVAEVHAFLVKRRDFALRAGIDESKIWLDPGVGFGKTDDHTRALLRALPELTKEGKVLLGISRKGFLGRLAGGAPAHDRLEGMLALHAWAQLSGVGMMRVHDVRATVRALDALDWLG